jgi:hypothetical protein
MTGMSGGDDLRGRAISSIKAKNHFWFMFAVWVVLSALFVVIWAVGGGGPFWPIWPILAIAIAVVVTFVRGYVRGAGAPDEARIQNEMRRLQ